MRRPLTGAVVVDSVLLFSKSLLAALAQGIFWLVAARLQPPEVVGVAGSLTSAALSLGFFSLLGLNFSLVRVLPASRRPASDVVTSLLLVAAVGLVLGAGFALLAPRLVGSLALLGHSPLVIGCFAVLVAGGAAGMLTDSAFLVLRAVPANVVITGVLGGALRCLLPFALVGFGAFGLFASAGLASSLAGLLGAWWIVRRLPRPTRWVRPPEGLRAVVRFSGAGYVTSVLDLVPVLVLPLLVLRERGPADNGVFFMCFQVATLLNAVVLAVVMSMFAEASRHPERAEAVTRRSAVVLAMAVTAAAAVLIPAHRLVLSVFGSVYADRGGPTLVVLALGAFAVAVNHWALMRLRIDHRLRSSVVMQAVTCVAVLGGAAVVAHRGLVWVAAAWGLGQLAGAVVGLVFVVRHRHAAGTRSPADGLPGPAHVGAPEAVR